MFYERFVYLCEMRGVTPSRAAIDAGLSKSTVTKWKNDPSSRPTGTVIDKLTRYFGISISELLGEKEEDAVSRQPTDAEIKFALFGGSGEITDAMYEEVRAFAAFLKAREAAKNKKE